MSIFLYIYLTPVPETAEHFISLCVKSTTHRLGEQKNTFGQLCAIFWELILLFIGALCVVCWSSSPFIIPNLNFWAFVWWYEYVNRMLLNDRAIARDVDDRVYIETFCCDFDSWRSEAEKQCFFRRLLRLLWVYLWNRFLRLVFFTLVRLVSAYTAESDIRHTLTAYAHNLAQKRDWQIETKQQKMK